MAGTVEARAVVRHDDRTRRGDDDRSRSRNDDGSRHNRSGCHDDWRRLRHDNGLRDDWRGLRHNDRSGLRHNWSGLCHDDRRGLGDDRRLRHDGRLRDDSGLGIDNDCRWRFDGFRDIGDGVHDVEHRVEAAVVEMAVVVMTWLSLQRVSSQDECGDGETDDGVACVLHVFLLFLRLGDFVDFLVFSVFTKPIWGKLVVFYFFLNFLFFSLFFNLIL